MYEMFDMSCILWLPELSIAKVLGQFIISIVTSAIFSLAPQDVEHGMRQRHSWMMGIMVYTI